MMPRDLVTDHPIQTHDSYFVRDIYSDPYIYRSISLSLYLYTYIRLPISIYLTIYSYTLLMQKKKITTAPTNIYLSYYM